MAVGSIFSNVKNKARSVFNRFFYDYGDAPAPRVQEQVRVLQDFITEHYYRCTDEILSGLGKMYVGGGEFTANIDAAGGEGTAAFVNRAIEIYCGK